MPALGWRRPSLLVGALVVAGCGLLPVAKAPTVADDLKAAESRWADKALDDYELTMRYYCLCPFQEPVRVTVEDDRVTAVTTLDGKPANAADVDWYPMLVESAFRAVEDNLGADEISVTFDPEFGFPASVRANPDDEMYDEEISFDVTDFVPGS